MPNFNDKTPQEMEAEIQLLEIELERCKIIKLKNVLLLSAPTTKHGEGIKQLADLALKSIRYKIMWEANRDNPVMNLAEETTQNRPRFKMVMCDECFGSGIFSGSYHQGINAYIYGTMQVCPVCSGTGVLAIKTNQ